MSSNPNNNRDSGLPPLRPDEVRYIRGLRIGVRVALAMLVVVFCIYVFGILSPHVPLDELPKYWGKPVSEFVSDPPGMPSGWQWTSRLHESDVVSMLPAVFLASLAGLCLLSILPIAARRGDRALVILIVLQVMVLVIAALPGVGGSH